MLVSALKCFSDVAMDEVSRCEQRKGFRSCFIKYDQGTNGSGENGDMMNINFLLVGGVSGRGERVKEADEKEKEGKQIFEWK